MRFIHYSIDNKFLTKQNLISVDKTKLIDDPDNYNDLNPGSNVLFLSKENPDGHSDWFNRCIEKNDLEYVNGTKNIFEIDLTNVLVLV